METVARIFESCREDRLSESCVARVAVAQEAGAACTEVSESRARRIPFSVEMFPPKGQLTLDAARKVVEGLRAASPDFISVTCSAGGSGNGHGGQTVAIAELIQNEAATPAVAHFTCVSATASLVATEVEALRAAGVETVLALRGDLAPGQEPAVARRLIRKGISTVWTRARTSVICVRSKMPAPTSSSPSCSSTTTTSIASARRPNLRVLRLSRAASCRFGEIADPAHGVPLWQLCRRPSSSFWKYEDDPVALRQAGIEYACNQLVDLGRHGVNGLHVYAMNQPDIACAAAEAVAAAGLR